MDTAQFALRMTILRATLVLICFLCSSCATPASKLESLTSCLMSVRVLNFTTAQSKSRLYESLLDASRQNMRFAEAGVLKPSALIFPTTAEQVQGAFMCSVKGNWTLRVRSGGHSYEGLSYTAESPFVVIDFLSMQAVKVDLASKTAWVETGANLGQLYESIARVTPDFGFPAGICPSVGVGGHFSGGGYGFLSRKYGLAADNVIDAQLVNAKGELVDRRGMGEDHFWALRGGGGGSWGIVVAWKIKLVPVPRNVTSFRLSRFGREQVADLVYRWQAVAPDAPKELELTMFMSGAGGAGNITKTSQVMMFGWYQGGVEETVEVVNGVYPEIGLARSDCGGGGWIEAVASVGGAARPELLMGRYNRDKGKFKAKSDYVTGWVPREAWVAVMKQLEEGPAGAYVYLEPYGGAMAEIAGNAIAFPHRKGNRYVIQYQARWGNASSRVDAAQLEWLRRLYGFMAPFVSKSPRAAYVNYIDLDLGTQGQGSGAAAVVAAESSWGRRYFRQNFRRLVDIKSRVDPLNLFAHPQGIPPL